jgi:hypothetical protein
MTVIEIRPYRNGWKVFEAPGVEPVFPSEVQAINYASNRASFRSAEIRVLDSNGNVTRTVRFSDTNGQRRSAAKEINPPPRGGKIRMGGRSILFPSPRVI